MFHQSTQSVSGMQMLCKVEFTQCFFYQVIYSVSQRKGFPGGNSGKEYTCLGRRLKRCGFNPWVGKIPWRRAWQPTPVFLPGESHGRRSLVGHDLSGHKESGMTEAS
ncbi:unnamed protein product [Rangifer tarandus platyrhynchus]|uniref:Uncharacterized protein n=1 Tax=Rangifer tarandus platyrhynchus TaxID=3082113 RepID=A0AC59Z7V5_RANTA